MWVSRVEDLETKDSVQIGNPFGMQENAGGLRSPLHMNGNAAQKINSASGVPKEAGVIISLSGAHGGYSPSSAMSLSGIDVNLFAAD